jgi:hypothetical protein
VHAAPYNKEKVMNAIKAAVIAVAVMGAGAARAEVPASQLLVPMGMSAEIGGGVTGFVDEKATGVTNPGAPGRRGWPSEPVRCSEASWPTSAEHRG